MKLRLLAPLVLMALPLNAQSLKEEIRAFASEVEALETTTENIDTQGEFISLRFDYLIKKSHISGLVSDKTKVCVLLSSGAQIEITPETKMVSPVVIHEALKQFLTSGRRQFKSADSKQQLKGRAFVQRAAEEDPSLTSGGLSTAQYFLAGISSWPRIAGECIFEFKSAGETKAE